MATPQINATLTKVEGVGTSADYDHAGGADDPKWEGSEGCYFQSTLARVPSGGETAVIGTRSLILDEAVDIDWSTGDTVTFTPFGGSEQTGEIQAIRVAAMPGVQGTVKLALEDA